MVKNNEIALQLKNNVTEDISVSIFPNVNSNSFDWNQTEGYYYNFGTTPYGMDETPTIKIKLKNTSIWNTVNLPYTGSPEGSGAFDPTEFTTFLANWIESNGYGMTFAADPEITIVSSKYDFGDLRIFEA